MATSTTRFLLVLSISSLLLFNVVCSSTTKDDDLDEDLSFLLDDGGDESLTHSEDHHLHQQQQFDDDEDENYDDFEGSEGDQEEEYSMPQVDEKDVVVLKEGNFSDFIEKNRYVLVEFYAPWCGHCQALAPEFAAAATELKGQAVLAKVDASVENELGQKYDVQGFPTLYIFIDGVHKPYSGHRTKEAIVTWVKKKTGPGISNVTTTEEADHILNTEEKLVVGFLDSLTGPQSDELAAASRLEDDVNFYQTANPDVAKLFHIDPKAKRPALVLLKKEAEKLSQFDGQFTKSEIVEFVFGNKLPLVTVFTRESAPLVFENPIKKQLLLFATSKDSEKVLPAFQDAAKLFKGKLICIFVEMDNEDVGKPVSEYFGVSDGPKILGYTGNEDARKFFHDGEVTLDTIKLLLFATSKDSEKVLPAFQDAAKLFKGKLICIFVEMDNEDVGKPVSEYFGVSDGPKILGYTGNEDARKFFHDGEVTLDTIKAFGADFLEDKLKPFFKSDPIPETNDEDVKIVVGNNFDDIVLDESKDVLLEIYAPWCGHCQSLEPTYNKLARHLRGVDSVVIAKMDGTTNEHPRAKADGFPTLLFFPAGNKSFDPITVDTDRTVVAFYKFIKKNASIAFKLQKSVSAKSEGADATPSQESSADNIKDEL
ncbi:disulfide isomerase-like 1-4 [Thalictrum thalictroides]|uniref:protein disulfide-isomerase n=1 Tax=Thalictrum thalictroides TaxID=46969 RepID=A0A7J6V289_THATH|nr:disulfide isomerase-like 1-4 [Thalictrum thalictroides]